MDTVDFKKVFHLIREDQGDKPILHDVPLLLRSLATRVEEGEFGDTSDPELILRVSVVVRSSNKPVIVLGMGKDNPLERTYMDLHAGAEELMSMSYPER